MACILVKSKNDKKSRWTKDGLGLRLDTLIQTHGFKIHRFQIPKDFKSLWISNRPFKYFFFEKISIT